MQQKPERDFTRCSECGATEVERTEVTRGYYSAHAKYDPEILIRYTDVCPSCRTVFYDHIEEEE